METLLEKIHQADNGGRRSGIDRRRFSYAFHIPERRDSNDRRSRRDRRETPRNGM